ncbi:unnamed protein product [Miscanthus lutarioriparius]|uniref:Uncharacterized protein n=1 Tax=Miscanthus lutarioriparius TaxID=422564 RepID=A0A811SGI2_9POAL|nr:unnamed protein product [Miscanthus lutarioriparius]
MHDEVGDSSGLLVSGIFSANKISGIDKVTTIAQKEGLKTALLGHFLALVAQLLKAEGIGMGNDGDLRVLLLSTCYHAAIGEFGKYGMMFAAQQPGLKIDN